MGKRAKAQGVMVCDPAPRAECKDHEGYRREPAGKRSCDDYTVLDAALGLQQHVGRRVQWVDGRGVEKIE